MRHEERTGQVNVDTTVREKNITYPTDSMLYLKALQKLAGAAMNRGVQLRQTYRRVAKCLGLTLPSVNC
jgi:IS5 family transposase